MQKFNELTHKDIKKFCDEWLAPEFAGMDFIITYDIDYDLTKIRFWKQQGVEMVSKKWHMPSFASEQQLISWLNGRLQAFMLINNQVEADQTGAAPTATGYVKGLDDG